MNLETGIANVLSLHLFSLCFRMSKTPPQNGSPSATSKFQRRQQLQLRRQQSESVIKRPGSMPLLAEAEHAPAHHCCRLVIVGSTTVGKTAIITRFLDDRFEEKYTPTIEDFHRKVYRIRGEAYRLDLLDTSGNNPFPAMRRLSLVTG